VRRVADEKFIIREIENGRERDAPCATKAFTGVKAGSCYRGINRAESARINEKRNINESSVVKSRGIEAERGASADASHPLNRIRCDASEGETLVCSSFNETITRAMCPLRFPELLTPRGRRIQQSQQQ